MYKKFLVAVAFIFVTLTTLMTYANDKTKEGEMNITGSCHCGEIKYVAQGPVIKCSICNCRGCQKATGGLSAPFMTVLKTKFKISGKQPSKFTAKNGDKCDKHGSWFFCKTCGTQIYWASDKGEEIDLFAGTLDNTKLFKIKAKK